MKNVGSYNPTTEKKLKANSSWSVF